MLSLRCVLAMVTFGWLLLGDLRADTIILPQIANGPHWRTTIRVINLFRGKQEFRFRFVRDDGKPWLGLAWSWRFSGTVNVDANGEFTFSASAGQVLEFRSSIDPFRATVDRAGYMIIDANSEVTKVSAFLTYYKDGRWDFEQGQLGIQTSRVGVPASPIATWVSLPFDEETGVALVNTGTKSISVQFRLSYTDIFGPDKTRIFGIDLGAGEHRAFFLKERVNEKSSVTSDYFGYLYIWTEDGADPFAAIGLIFRDDGVMTSLPVHVIRSGPF